MKRALLALALPALIVAALLAPAGAGAATGPGLPKHSLELIVELRHPAGLAEFVKAVSDPDSPRYRRYAGVEWLINRFSAAKPDRNAALRWLAARGVDGELDATGNYVVARLSRQAAAKILPRPAEALASAAGDTVEPEVPAALRGAVTGIALIGPDQNVVKNVASASAKQPAEPKNYSSILPHSGTASGCEQGRIGPGLDPQQEPFTPNQFTRAYGIDSMHARGFEGQGQTVALVEIDGFRRKDIETYDRCFGVKTPPIRVVPVFPFTKPDPNGTETTLDLEVITTAAPKLDRILVYEGLGTKGGILITAGTALGSRGNRPDVVSISLGICEPEYSGHIVVKRALDNVFAIAAGAGISVLVAAGDTGSSGCRVNAKEGTTALPVRAVSLPSSSPYVTAVGGTNMQVNAKNRLKREIVWNDSPLLAGGGGGGVSLLTARRPWWQQMKGLEQFGVGRVVPDIAALADPYPGYAYFCTSPECGDLPQLANPGWTSIGGTSAATPLMASGIALANQYAERRGQPNLGFLNPLIYKLGADRKARQNILRDVTHGDNDLGRLLPVDVGGGHKLGCCAAGKGYDWASGWGSLKVLGFTRAAAHAAP